MAEGWVKLHRCLLDKAIWKSSKAEQKAVLITILLLANHKDNEWEWQGKKYTCKPGQFITSLQSLAEVSGTSIQVIRTSLLRFEKYEFLTNESTKTGRLITVVNWGIYQSKDEEANKATNKDLTNSQQTTNKDLTTNNNDNNEKNDKKTNNIINPSSSEKEIFDYWNSQRIVVHPKFTNGIRIAIELAVKRYSSESIKTAIDHYAIMFFDNNYEWCTYKWGIEKFLEDPKGIMSFMDDGQKWLSYQNIQKNNSKESCLFNEFGDPIPGAFDQTPI